VDGVKLDWIEGVESFLRESLSPRRSPPRKGRCRFSPVRESRREVPDVRRQAEQVERGVNAVVIGAPLTGYLFELSGLAARVATCAALAPHMP